MLCTFEMSQNNNNLFLLDPVKHHETLKCAYCFPKTKISSSLQGLFSNFHHHVVNICYLLSRHLHPGVIFWQNNKKNSGRFSTSCSNTFHGNNWWNSLDFLLGRGGSGFRNNERESERETGSVLQHDQSSLSSLFHSGKASETALKSSRDWNICQYISFSDCSSLKWEDQLHESSLLWYYSEIKECNEKSNTN